MTSDVFQKTEPRKNRIYPLFIHVFFFYLSAATCFLWLPLAFNKMAFV